MNTPFRCVGYGLVVACRAYDLGLQYVESDGRYDGEIYLQHKSGGVVYR